MSLRRKVSHFLALALIAVMSVALFAGVAEAKSTKLSAKQKAHIRASLRKQVKKNPRIVQRKSFLRKASLVNFRLPVTIRLRGGKLASNPNSAAIDLGPSLGTRDIGLGGSLAAEIVFHDSFDGGALGNVDIDIRPSSTRTLSSTSIPLLWNSQVSQAGSRWDAVPLIAQGAPLPSSSVGCANFNGTSALPFGPSILPTPGGPGLPGFPFGDLALATANSLPATTPFGYLPENPGVDAINQLQASKIVGNPNNLGANPNPFPSDPSITAAGVQDTVLRTGPLSLSVATPGTTVNPPVPNNGATDPAGNTPVQNSQKIVIGKSGGQANLFGNIPGKSYGIDVSVSLATRINSIFRVVDQDTFGAINAGDKYPAALFTCRQIWSGGIDNYIPGVRLQGSLKISPAITTDGRLRIAKATLSSGAMEKANVALAACLVPYSPFAKEQNNSDTVPQTVPAGTFPPPSTAVADSVLPVDTQNSRPAPAADCNTGPSQIVKDGALIGSVTPLLGASTSNGYTVNNTGSQAVVSGLLTVNNVSADVLVGDVGDV